MSLTAIKLGGSLITDKTQEATFRKDVMARIARELQLALAEDHSLKLLVGHGSGSFGHFEANRYATISGVQSSAEWYGFTRVADAAARLNKLVAADMLHAQLPVFPVQPSALAVAQDGIIQTMNLTVINHCLQHGLIPLVYGDVAFDVVRGGTIISTETIFNYLTANLPVSRVILVGEVDGVYDGNGAVIPHISAANFDEISVHLGSSRGIDVTGGMYAKVRDMLQITQTPPHPEVFVINGLVDNRLYLALTGQDVLSTRISAG